MDWRRSRCLRRTVAFSESVGLASQQRGALSSGVELVFIQRLNKLLVGWRRSSCPRQAVVISGGVGSEEQERSAFSTGPLLLIRGLYWVGGYLYLGINGLTALIRRQQQVLWCARVPSAMGVIQAPCIVASMLMREGWDVGGRTNGAQSKGEAHTAAGEHPLLRTSF